MDTVYHDKRGYENIIVTFSSGVNRVLGETPKEFSKIITKYNCDILYIYDDLLSWYVNGVKGYESVKLLSEHITTIISGYKNSGFLGSSMGGYAAYMLSGFYGTPIIAFNPALHSRKFNPKFPNKVQTYYPSKAKIILGEEDTVIDPKQTIRFITDHISNGLPQINIENINGMGHRVPLDIFINKTQNEL